MPAVVSDISESLREQERYEEVAEKQDADGEPGDDLDAHSRSTPLTISAVSAKKATARATNSRSAMRTPIT